MTRRRSNVASGDDIRLATAGSEAVIAAMGAEPVQWRVGGRDLLWSGDPAHWGWHAPVLFPVVGQVKGGRIRIAGHSYPMARHGFARTSRFRCMELKPDRVQLRLEGQAGDPGFPLPFALDVSATLRASSLSLDFVVHNPGPGVLPYAVGFHPAFPWPFDGGDPTDYALRFDRTEVAQVPVITPDGLIGKSVRSIALKGDRLPLEPELFRDDALVFLNAESRSLRFEAPSGAAIVMQADECPHRAVWTKPGAPFLSLEAWTGYADPEGFEGDFADKPSMILLPAGRHRHHRVALSFEAAER